MKRMLASAIVVCAIVWLCKAERSAVLEVSPAYDYYLEGEHVGLAVAVHNTGDEPFRVFTFLPYVLDSQLAVLPSRGGSRFARTREAKESEYDVLTAANMAEDDESMVVGPQKKGMVNLMSGVFDLPAKKDAVWDCFIDYYIGKGVWIQSPGIRFTVQPPTNTATVISERGHADSRVFEFDLAVMPDGKRLLFHRRTKFRVCQIPENVSPAFRFDCERALLCVTTENDAVTNVVYDAKMFSVVSGSPEWTPLWSWFQAKKEEVARFNAGQPPAGEAGGGQP